MEAQQMIFFYSPLAGNVHIVFENEEYHYLVRVRRHKKGDTILLQDMHTPKAFQYKIKNISKKTLELQLEKTEEILQKHEGIHLGWGMCEASTIYQALPFLNQLGVQKISFLQTERSQHKILLKPEKIKAICIQSSQQCGRNHLLEWEMVCFDDFLAQHPKSILLDIKGGTLQKPKIKVPILVGPEGGWSDAELAKVSANAVQKLHGNLVLKSETAAIAAACFFT